MNWNSHPGFSNSKTTSLYSKQEPHSKKNIGAYYKKKKKKWLGFLYRASKDSLQRSSRLFWAAMSGQNKTSRWQRPDFNGTTLTRHAQAGMPWKGASGFTFAVVFPLVLVDSVNTVSFWARLPANSQVEARVLLGMKSRNGRLELKSVPFSPCPS